MKLGEREISASSPAFLYKLQTMSALLYVHTIHVSRLLRTKDRVTLLFTAHRKKLTTPIVQKLLQTADKPIYTNLTTVKSSKLESPNFFSSFMVPCIIYQ